jgi:rRNA maturation endonuclease Nob1
MNQQCPTCGEWIDDDTVEYCPSCGEPLPVLDPIA